MKKFIYSAIAAIGLLLSPSCSDENEALSGSGNEALVSFSVNLADGIQTKADPEPVIGDGTTAEKLYVRVFDDGGTLIDGLSDRTYDFSNRSTEVTLSLVKGKTYKFLFWAQSGETNAFSFDGTTVNVSYANAKANDEKRDAFYYAYTKTVTGSFQETVTLRRPFAQLNFLTTAEDIKAAINAGQRVEKTSITVASAARTLSPSFDPANTNPSVSVEKENAYFDFADVPFTVEDNTVSSPSCLWIKDGKVEETQGEGATKYFYLATTYFLVNNTADATAQIVLADVNMKVYGAEGDGLKVQSVPVRMNYRTNIYGNLLTSTGKFNVTITPNFNIPQLPEQDQDIEIKEREVDSEAAAAAAFAAGASKVTLTEELPQVSESSGIIPQTYARENTEVIELVLEKPITEGYVFTYKEPEQGATNTSAPATVHITIPEGSTTINESNIQLPQSTVYVNGVKVTTMTAETYSHTLVVGPGTEIGTLNVKQGHVRIMNGGQVGTIVNQTANPRVDVIVDLEEGGTLENIPDVSTTKIIVRRSISTAEGLKDFAAEVNSGKTYAGQTVVLSADIDLNDATWTPIGLNADDTKKFKGTFDGQNHTIKNFKVAIGNVYQAAGFFGALNGTAQNFTIENATISSQSTGNSSGITDNGVAVVAGSIYSSGSIENVTVRNSSATGHHYVAGIAGYVYGNIENCKVENSTFTSTPNVQGSSYDNGDKVGGIVGYLAKDDYTTASVENCSVKNVTVQGHRDIGGICGTALAACTLTNNRVDNITMIQSDENKYKEDVSTVAAIVSDRVTGYSETGSSIGAVTFKLDQAGALQKIVKTNATSLAIQLACDAAVNIKPWVNANNEYLWGGSTTNSVSIIGKTGNEILTFNNVNSDWNYIACANESAEINISNLKLTNSGCNDGPWNRHDIYFNNPVTLTNVSSDKAIAVRANSTLERVTIADKRATDDYGLWIVALGQTVTVKDCVIDMVKEGASGRAIKISDQYVCLSHDGSTDPSSVAKTKLSVSGTTFKSQKKAAVLVGSCGGADITLGTGNNIGEVNADTTCPVWVDAAYSSSYEKVTVNNGEVGLKKQEE